MCQDCSALLGRLYLVILQNTVSGELMYSCFMHFIILIYDGCVCSNFTPNDLLDLAVYMLTLSAF